MRKAEEQAGPTGHGESCSDFHAAIELIGRRWNGVILQRLFDGPHRFGELRDRIPRITDAMLSQRLKEFEAAGIVERIVTVGRPVEIRYQLTDIGTRLAPVFDAVESWGAAWSAGRPAN
ncbi:winged helix-turn-helix transcriptional regulator [Streptomyces sp. NPDC020965]|uniref:winged helix-turn-helix transcriptional regulator n=1 Tax=Streptomyces sp. NPDC020965 TaxID=3365105 RepID=UPI0037BA0B31